MDFPTAEQFEQNKIQTDNTILKWREVPTDIIYRIDGVDKMNTQIGEAMVVALSDKDGNNMRVFATSILKNDLRDFKPEYQTWYIKSIGKRQSKKNPGQSFYHYELMKKN